MRMRKHMVLTLVLCTLQSLLAATVCAGDLPYKDGQTYTYTIENREGTLGSYSFSLQTKDTPTLTESLAVKLPAYEKTDQTTLRLTSAWLPKDYVSSATLAVPAKPQQNGKYELSCTIADGTANARLVRDGKPVFERPLPFPAGAFSFANFRLGQWALLAAGVDASKETRRQVFHFEELRALPLLLRPVTETATFTLQQGSKTITPVGLDMLIGNTPVGRLLFTETHELVAVILPGAVVMRRSDIQPFVDALLPADQRAIHGLLDKLQTAWMSETLGMMLALFDPKATCAEAAPENKVHTFNREEWMTHIQGLWKNHDYLQHKLVQRQIQISGPTAIVQCLLIDQAKNLPQQTIPYTLFLARQGSSWIIISTLAGVPELDFEALRKELDDAKAKEKK